jgi:hypothetical protein
MSKRMDRPKKEDNKKFANRKLEKGGGPCHERLWSLLDTRANAFLDTHLVGCV